MSLLLVFHVMNRKIHHQYYFFIIKINLPKFRLIESLRYSYFEEFEFLRQLGKKQNMTKKKYQLNRNESLLTKHSNVLPFYKPKFKFAVQWSLFLET